MQSWFDTGEDVVWFKADHVVQETSEFVYFTFDFDHWSSVFLNEVYVLTNFRFELGVFGLEFWDEVFLLKNFQVLLTLIVILQFGNLVTNSLLEPSKLI